MVVLSVYHVIKPQVHGDVLTKYNMNPEIEKLRKDLDDLISEFYRNNFSSSQDFTKYSRFKSRIKMPIYATAPTTCEVGEIYVNSGTGKAYVCSAENTWQIIGSQS